MTSCQGGRPCPFNSLRKNRLRLSDHGELDEDIDYITILVYRAPEVLAFTLYLYEDLVQVPCVTETTLPTLQSSSVFRPELNAPQSDRFVRNVMPR